MAACVTPHLNAYKEFTDKYGEGDFSVLVSALDRIWSMLVKKGQDIPKNLPQEIDFLDREYPEVDIELVIVDGKFNPTLIKSLSKKWSIPINFMFIGSPSDKFPYKIEELGGVRLII